MKIMALVGSGRKNGNTHQVTALVGEHLARLAQAAGVPLAFELLHLSDFDIQSCRGCRACFDQGEILCPNRDDFLTLRNRVLAADALLLASPVYVDDVSGLTKTLIDRMAYACHRPAFAGRVAFALATAGITPPRRALGTASGALRLWGFHLAGQAGFITGGTLRGTDCQVRFDRPAAAAASRLFQAVYSRAWLRPTFVELMIFKIQQRAWQKTGDSVDLRYWREKGWLDAACSYYLPHQTSRLKIALARGAGAVLAPFVS